MPSFSVSTNVDVDLSYSEMFDEISDEKIKAEYKRRFTTTCDIYVKPMTKLEIDQSLDAASFELRKINRNDLAFRLDEIRHDYFK